jgi:D-alanyl-D-alanine carboxypeptidase
MKKLKSLTKSNLKLLTLVGILYIGSNIFYQAQTSNQLRKLDKALYEENLELNQKVEDIETVLLATQEDNLTMAEALEEARERAEELADEFDDVNDNVEELEKITKTDPELLQKYSKVYFLNEHYSPDDLRTIPSKWTYNPNREYEIHSEVYPYLKDLLEEAEDDGLNLQIISAFRSFETQEQLKGAYTVQYGAGANTFSADQGYSEHQLGTTVDFTNPEVGATFSGFAQTEEYQWLRDNAHKYGFTMSYPENNQYYQFEPWHWRFVGEDLADDLHDDNKFFYDLSQREIDKYIADLFD